MHVLDTRFTASKEDFVIQTSLEFFMKFKEAIVLKKLSGVPEALNGVELRNCIDPKNAKRLASYWLDDNEATIANLKRLGLIEEFQTHIGRRGYGDDRGFRLTPASKSMVHEFKDNVRIEAAVGHVLMFGKRLHV